MKPGHRHLALGALAALTNLNARKPLTRHELGSVLAFASGWPVSDVPLLAGGVQAAGAAAAIRNGALRTTGGKLGLALTVASWKALYDCHEAAVAAPAVLERALIDELGADYRSRQAPAPAARRDARRLGFLPTPRVRSAYVRDGNIAYGEAGRRNHLDIWRRDDLALDAKAPVIVNVHGGAWITVSHKDHQAYPLLTHFAERGWVAVSFNYRLSPRATWPEHVIDVKRALAWVREHIADYGGDPDWIAVTGGSAGGHLSSLAALTPNDPEFQPAFEDIDTTVQAAVPYYGVYDWTNRDEVGHPGMLQFLEKMIVKAPFSTQRDVYEKASPMSRITADAPPFFVIHGANDTLVPVEQARRFVELLRKSSDRPVAYAELPGAQHSFDVMRTTRALATVDAVERFLDVVRDPR